MYLNLFFKFIKIALIPLWTYKKLITSNKSLFINGKYSGGIVLLFII